VPPSNNVFREGAEVPARCYESVHRAADKGEYQMMDRIPHVCQYVELEFQKLADLGLRGQPDGRHGVITRNFVRLPTVLVIQYSPQDLEGINHTRKLTRAINNYKERRLSVQSRTLSARIEQA